MREVGELWLNIGSVSFQAGPTLSQRSLNTRVYQRLIHEAIAIATGSWGWGPLSIHRFCPPIALSWRSSVKHINAIARATSRSSFRRFFKHIILIISKTYQRDDVSERDKQRDHFQNCYTVVALRAGCRASRVAFDIALLVALVCGQSRDFRVCLSSRASSRSRSRWCVYNFTLPLSL